MALQTSYQKSRIRETKNLSTDADSSTDTFFPAVFHQKIADYGRVLIKDYGGGYGLLQRSHQGDRVLMAVRNTFFIAGYGPLHRSHQGGHQEIAGYGAGYGPLQRSHQGDHQEIAGYGAGYGPLKRSHQGDHHEIAGYGPLQSSHQGCRVLIDQ